jgi:hypothetical protein
VWTVVRLAQRRSSLVSGKFNNSVLQIAFCKVICAAVRTSLAALKPSHDGVEAVQITLPKAVRLASPYSVTQQFRAKPLTPHKKISTGFATGRVRQGRCLASSFLFKLF